MAFAPVPVSGMVGQMMSYTLARSVVTWGGAMLISMYLLATAMAQPEGVSWPPLLGVVGIVLLLGWGSRRVVDWFWVRRVTPAEGRKLDVARRVGIRAAAVFTVCFGTFLAWQAPEHLVLRALVLFVALMLCFGFAMWLCAGYVFATIMDRFRPGRRR